MRVNKERKRQFSEIRLASRSKSAKSRLENATPNPTHSRVSKLSDFKPTHDNGQALVCVNCYNQKLSAGKRKQKLSRAHNLSCSGHNLSLLGMTKAHPQQNVNSEVKKVNDFNLKMISDNQRRRKAEEAANKNKLHEQISQKQARYYNQMEKRKQYELEQRLRLKEDLERQIHLVRNRRIEQQQEQKSQKMNNIIGERPNNQQARQKHENEYKNQLLRQISDNRMRKKNMNSENQENELQLVTFAENRRALAEKKSILTKEAILEDAKRRKEMERARKEKEIADRAKQEQKRKTFMQNEDQRMLAQQDQRRNQIEKYLSDLKAQMQLNKAKRETDMKWFHQGGDHCIIESSKGLPPTKECDCCSKKFPQTYLTPFTEIPE